MSYKAKKEPSKCQRPKRKKQKPTEKKQMKFPLKHQQLTKKALQQCRNTFKPLHHSTTFKLKSGMASTLLSADQQQLRTYACGGNGTCNGSGSCGNHSQQPTHNHEFGQYTTNLNDEATKGMLWSIQRNV